MSSALARGAARKGELLLPGLLRCGHCGRKLHVRQSLMERIANVQDSGLADEVIIEEYEGQKIHDIQRLGIDVFAIGSDWEGRFDYLNDYCRVVYLDRTKGVSSTELRAENHGILSIGVALEEALGVKVDVGTPSSLRPRLRDEVLAEALPL